MSSSPKTTTTTSDTKGTTSATSTPLDAQAPMFQDIWKQGTAAALAPPTNWIAPANSTQMDAIKQLIAAAPTLGTNAGSLRDVAGKVANGYFLDPNNDPTFQGAANAAIRPVTQQLTESVLPQIVDASIRNGGVGGGPAAYGGARQDIQENQAVRNWTQTAGDLTAKMAADSRAQGLKLIPSAPGLDQGATTAALTPAGTLGQAGTQMQAYDQLGLDNNTKAWLASLTGAQQGANILNTGGFGNKAGTTTSNNVGTQTTPAPDLTTQWLQGITGVAGMGASLMTGIPGLGAGVSSIFGGMGGLPNPNAGLVNGNAPWAPSNAWFNN